MHLVTRLVGLLVLGFLPVALVADPAVGRPAAKPKPGTYTGSANYASGPVQVTFTVNHTRTKVTNFNSDALVKPGCTAPNSSFETPITPKKISSSGRFKQVYSAYTDASGNPYHVTVTVKGRFTSASKAVGEFILVSKRYKHCNQNASWSAVRSS